MKRITFVLAGIALITIFVLTSQKTFEDDSVKYVKMDTNKHHLKAIYD